MPFELRKFVAPEFLFGVGALDLAGQYARHLGARNVLIVTDAGVAAAGWPDRVMHSLDHAGLRWSTYDRVSPNPRQEEVAEGAEFCRSAGCDALLAVGGGSPMDCAKGIGVVASSGRPIAEFEGVDKIPESMPPLLCIPTTAGTGADVSQFTIIGNREERRKMAIVSKAVVPDLALVDPLCTTTMDAYLTACTAVDALTHAIEAFVSTGSSPITDLHAEEAIRLVGRHILAVLLHPADLEERGGMALASLQAGLAFSNASLGAVHAMAHALGGLLDLPHGECNALLLEHVVDFNFPAAPERYRRVAANLGVSVDKLSDGEVRRALRERLCGLRKQAGIEGSLSGRGVSRDDIPGLTRNAIRDICMVTNPRVACQRDIEVIYESAL
jgi:alcohol dehydrogenase class IV